MSEYELHKVHKEYLDNLGINVRTKHSDLNVRSIAHDDKLLKIEFAWDEHDVVIVEIDLTKHRIPNS